MQGCRGDGDICHRDGVGMGRSSAEWGEEGDIFGLGSVDEEKCCLHAFCVENLGATG